MVYAPTVKNKKHFANHKAISLKVSLLDYPRIPPVNYQWLIDLDNKNIKTTIPPGLTEEINIKKLLDGILTEEDRYSRESDRKQKLYRDKVKKLSMKEEIKEIFISYSWTKESKKITVERKLQEYPLDCSNYLAIAKFKN